MKNVLSGLVVFFLFVGNLLAIDIVTKSGKTYKNAEIERATERGLLIMHEIGAAVIPYSDLPDDLQKKYQEDAERFKAKKVAMEKQAEGKQASKSDANAADSPQAVSPQITETPNPVTTSVSGGTSSGGRTIYTGPRGGRYYINSNGNKTYIRKKK